MRRYFVVRFSQDDYARLRNTYDLWWKGELDRPIVPIVIDNAPSPKPLPLRFETAWDKSVSPKELIGAHDEYLSRHEWYGEAFPALKTEAFGPGAMAAFLGCAPVGKKDTVWFEAPGKDIPIEELHFEPDDANPNLRRVLNIYEAAMEKWQGRVVVGMVDMGGILDVLSSFRGSENLLMDLYDAPDEVHRCIDELQKCWFYYYDKINALMGDSASGYTQWFPLYGAKPGYILQSDFSYMIGPDMFDEFVAPELKSSAARLTNAVYHLDGMGEIPHLDSILKINDIKGIQWVPGAGAPESMKWDELLLKILNSGKKLISLSQDKNGLPIALAKNPGQLYLDGRTFEGSDRDSARKYAAHFGISI